MHLSISRDCISTFTARQLIIAWHWKEIQTNTLKLIAILNVAWFPTMQVIMHIKYYVYDFVSRKCWIILFNSTLHILVIWKSRLPWFLFALKQMFLIVNLITFIRTWSNRSMDYMGTLESCDQCIHVTILPLRMNKTEHEIPLMV